MTSKSAAYGIVLQIYELAVGILIVCIQADVRSLTRRVLSAKKKEKKITSTLFQVKSVCKVSLRLNGLHLLLWKFGPLLKLSDT